MKTQAIMMDPTQRMRKNEYWRGANLSQSQLARNAIKFLASTVPVGHSKRMEENHETLKYAYNTNWTIAQTEGLIQHQKARRHTTHTRSHKQDVAQRAHDRIKAGESLYSVAKDLCVEHSKLRNWLQLYTEFTTIGALRGAE